ncbi:MAG: MFS transporter [Hyphomonadaceae bacterium]|nr:MFS transporter [Hyphomonadaceae bacterium]
MSATETGADSQAPAIGGPTLTPLQRLRAILGGSAGNLVEWYDWFAYASFTLYFAPAFFPEGDRTAQLLQAAAVLALGFLARPIGAWLLGLYADRAGRRAALSLSVGMMCFGSLIIALTPGHATIGAWAPAILLCARVLQGLSVGGEYGASATYMSEMAGRKRRGLWSSFQYVTLILGQLCALGVLILLQRTLTDAQLDAWGWRIPFFIGAALAVVVFWIRRGLEESQSWTNRTGERSRTMLLFLHYPKETAMIAGLTAAGSLSFYAYTTYMQKFLVNTAGFSRDVASEISAGALVVFMLAQPLFGWVSDLIGRKRMLIAAFGLGALAAYPVFTGIATARSEWTAFALVVGALLILSAYTSIGAVIKAELFPAHVRALGVALPYALANAVFGGTAEYVALWFKQAGFEQGFYLYVAVVAAVALVVSIFMRDTQKQSLILED